MYVRYNRLIPELKCSDFKKAFDFYTRVLGFRVLYDRPEDDFAMLDFEGSQLMIELHEPESRWVTGDMKYPLGQGINLQIEANDVDALAARIKAAGVALFMEMEEAWYRTGENRHVGNRQFLVQDPDGYLLRFFQDLGER